VTNGGLVSLLVVLEARAVIVSILDVEVLKIEVTKSTHFNFIVK
jgi:hypothetical protein